MRKLLQQEQGMFAVVTALIAGTTVIILIVSLLLLAGSAQRLESGNLSYDQIRLVSVAGLDNALSYLATNPTDAAILAFTPTAPRIGPGQASQSVISNNCYSVWFSNLRTSPKRVTVHVVSIAPINAALNTLTAVSYTHLTLPTT